MQKTKKYQERLMETIGFDSDDLRANQNGKLSERQTHLLERQSGQWLDLSVLAILVALSVSAYFVANGLQHGESFSTLSINVGVVCAIALVVVAYGWVNRGEDAQFLAKPRIACAEGRIQLDVQTHYRGGSEYQLLVDEVGFNLSKPVFLAFKNGDPYRIYYAPHSKRILSVEWLRDDDNLLR